MEATLRADLITERYAVSDVFNGVKNAYNIVNKKSIIPSSFNFKSLPVTRGEKGRHPGRTEET